MSHITHQNIFGIEQYAIGYNPGLVATPSTDVPSLIDTSG